MAKKSFYFLLALIIVCWIAYQVTGREKAAVENSEKKILQKGMEAVAVGNNVVKEREDSDDDGEEVGEEEKDKPGPVQKILILTKARWDRAVVFFISLLFFFA